MLFVAGIDAHATYSLIAIVSNTGEFVHKPVCIKNTEADRLDGPEVHFTQMANRIHSQRHNVGLHLERGRLLTQDGREWVRTEAWPRLGDERSLFITMQWALIDQGPGPTDGSGRLRSRCRESRHARARQPAVGVL